MKGSENLAIFSKNKPKPQPDNGIVSPARVGDRELFRLSPAPGDNERELYAALREQVPIIDAAIGKIIRLTGGFKAVANNPAYQPALDWFCENV